MKYKAPIRTKSSVNYYSIKSSLFAVLLLILVEVQAHRLRPETEDTSLVQLDGPDGALGAWGFSKNIINIDTFFAAPTKSEPKALSQKGKHSDGGGEATAEALEEHQETAEEHRQREAKEKLKKEQQEKERLKKLVEKEAAEKAVEAMMISLDADSGEESDEEEEDDAKVTTQASVNATVKAQEERERIRNEQLNSLENSTLFTIVFSTPSAPDDVKQVEQNCSTLSEVQNFFSNDKVKGLKMLFGNGQLLKTNVNYQDNEFEYYRLVGEAYNAHKLDRAQVNSKQVQLLQQAEGPTPAAKPEPAANTVFFTYVVDGVPQTLPHNTLSDAKYGYSKQVFVKGKQGPEAASEGSYKLYSTSCSKLAQNKNNEARLRDCRLASGYFLVNQVGLFRSLCNAGSDGFSREAMESCGLQMKKVTVS